MKTDEIADIIIQSMAERSFLAFLTTFQGAGLDESDVLGINPSEYIFEYEIKRSRSDFRADFKKIHKHTKLKNPKDWCISSYDDRKNGKKTGNKIEYINIPNRFYYVCVEGLIKPEEVPEYAGLIWIKNHANIKEMKKAPLLHRNKANKMIYKRISAILSQRIIYGCSYFTYLQNKTNKEFNL